MKFFSIQIKQYITIGFLKMNKRMFTLNRHNSLKVFKIGISNSLFKINESLNW